VFYSNVLPHKTQQKQPKWDVGTALHIYICNKPWTEGFML